MTTATIPSALPYWQVHHGGTWCQKYWDSVTDHHRGFFAEKIGALAPFDSLLEVGCHCGPNLRKMRGLWPNVALTGIDPSAEAIRFARAQPELSDVKLRCGQIGLETKWWADRAFDVVATCYALSYIPPDKTVDALAECWRLTAKAFVIFEPMQFDGGPVGFVGGQYVEYRHNYFAALCGPCAGSSADVYEYVTTDNRLNGLIVIRRP